MLSLTDAEALLLRSFIPTGAKTVSVDQGLGQILAADVRAELTQPRWPQVAMDGYAVRRGDHAAPRWALQPGCAATGMPQHGLLEGRALRTTTGAPLPHGADTVVMQEDAEVRAGADGDNRAIELRDRVEVGANVRPAGQDFCQGDVIAYAGSPVTPGMVALLHHAGVTQLPVYPKPRLAAVITGSELAASPCAIPDHQTPDSNGPFLAALAAERGYAFASAHCDESPEALASALDALREDADVLIVCGGASVGPKDGSHAGLQSVGARLVFSKVAQKPGKPMAAYDWDGKPVLLLPGNPAAVYCCAYWHLLPLLQSLAGARPQKVMAMLEGEAPAVGNRSLLLRAQARIENGTLRATLLGGQLSHLLSSTAGCNALLRLDPGATYAPGSLVDCVLLGPLDA